MNMSTFNTWRVSVVSGGTIITLVVLAFLATMIDAQRCGDKDCSMSRALCTGPTFENKKVSCGSCVAKCHEASCDVDAKICADRFACVTGLESCIDPGYNVPPKGFPKCGDSTCDERAKLCLGPTRENKQISCPLCFESCFWLEDRQCKSTAVQCIKSIGLKSGKEPGSKGTSGADEPEVGICPDRECLSRFQLCTGPTDENKKISCSLCHASCSQSEHSGCRSKANTCAETENILFPIPPLPTLPTPASCGNEECDSDARLCLGPTRENKQISCTECYESCSTSKFCKEKALTCMKRISGDEPEVAIPKCYERECLSTFLLCTGPTKENKQVSCSVCYESCAKSGQPGCRRKAETCAKVITLPLFPPIVHIPCGDQECDDRARLCLGPTLENKQVSCSVCYESCLGKGPDCQTKAKKCSNRASSEE